MDLTPQDKIALRAALHRLNASSSALSEATSSITEILERAMSGSAPVPSEGSSLAPTEVPQPSESTGRHSSTQPTEPTEFAEPPRALVSVVKSQKSDHKSEHSPPAYPVPPRRPKQIKEPVSTEVKIMRAVAIGGAIITVAGVALLVALAVQRGWLGPLGRVIGAYLLAAILIGAGIQVKRVGPRVDAVAALITTGLITANVTTWALVDILGWWSPGPASALMLACNLGTITLGRFWSGPRPDSDPTPGAGYAVMMCAVVVTGATAILHSGGSRGHFVVYGILLAVALTFGVADRTLRNTLAVLAVILQLGMTQLLTTTTTLSASVLGIITALVFTGLALWVPLEKKGTKDIGGRAANDIHSAGTLSGIIAPTVIILALIPPLGELNAIWWLLLPTAAVTLIGLYGQRNVPEHAADGIYAASRDTDFPFFARLLAILGLCQTAVAFVIIRYYAPQLGSNATLDATVAVVVFFIVASLLVLALIRVPRKYDLGLVPLVVWILAAAGMVAALARNVLWLTPLWLTDTVAVIQALAICVFIAAVLVARKVFYPADLWLQIVVGLALLYLSLNALVTLATWIGHSIAGEAGMFLGFLIGHAGTSVLWMVLAAALMLSRRLYDAKGALWTGLALAIAGTVKLVFFDLGALSGVPRAMAFLASGIALLAIAAMRGRRRPQQQEQPSAPSLDGPTDQSTSERNSPV